MHTHTHTHMLSLAAIPPHLVNQPTRAYPLRTLNEPAVNVFGDKGPAVRQNGAPMPSPAQQQPMPFGARGDPQAMLAHQNREMEALERRSMRERSLSTTQMSQMQQVCLYVLCTGVFHGGCFGRRSGRRPRKRGTRRIPRTTSSISRRARSP